MRFLLFTVFLLAPLTAYAQEELTTTAPVYTTAPTTKFVVGSILLDFKIERVVGTLVNEVKTVGTPGFAGTLTVRTSNSVGTLTMTAADHGIVTGQEINVAWNSGANFRRNMVAGTVAGTSVPISGGKGDALPAAAFAITAPATLTRTFGVELPPIEWTGAKARSFLKKANSGNFTTKSLHAEWIESAMKDDAKLAGAIGGTPD